MNKNLTPDSTVMQQLEGKWQSLAMLLLYKLAGRERVVLTAEEIGACLAEFAPGTPVLFTHGQSDSLTFQVIDESAARLIAAHEATLKGTA